ncbi:MAG: hypothetical protein J6B16_05615 [Clostridia bacterium]|nr:hypothetical protein [Clostridia bacterium]
MKKALKLITLVVAMMLVSVMFIACVPSNPEKAEKKLKDAGYSVIVTEITDAMESMSDELDGVSYVVYANKDDDTVMIYYFEKGADAKDAYDEMKEEQEEAGDELKDFVIKKSGKAVVVASSKDAWKDIN